jgi:GH25 family lysozyme M1 (1,4-beta-N-acetylmuramidase)
MTEVKKGIDVSKWNGAVDFKAVKKAGYDFVIINAGYGRYIHQKDLYFETNYKRAKDAGLNVGAYWYSYATTATDAEQEAKTFLEAIKGKTFEYPLAFDIEDPSQYGLSNKTINAMCKSFCSYLEKNGYYAMIYSFADFLENRISAANKKAYDIWVASFTTADKPYLYTGPYGIWQHNDNTHAPGVKGDVDTNRAYKDYPAIIKSAGLNGFPKIKMEEPKPKKKVTKGDVNGDGKVNVTDVTVTAAAVKGKKKLTTEQKEAADMNNDGKVTSADAEAIANKIKGIPEKPKTKIIKYTIRYGDTLIGIAKKYGVSVIDIAELNGIKDVNKILAGQVIEIKVKED